MRQTYIGKLFGGLAMAAMLAAPGGAAFASDYPSKPIRLIVPFAPGGAVDQIGRTLSGRLGDILGQSVIVENRAGASGSVGAAEVARSAPDGYTLGLALDSHAVNHHMVSNLPFDTFQSFDYLSLLVTLPQVLVTRADYPVNTIPGLVEHIKQNKNVSYGSAGTGSAGHVNTATMTVHYGIEPTHIPYRGAGPLLVDLLGGHIDFAFAGLSVMLPQIEAGTLTAVAISTAERSPKVPDVPTVAESIPGFEIPTWIGLVAPAGLQPEVRERILAALRETMKTPEIREKLEGSAFNIVVSTPEDFLERARADDKTMRDLVQRGVIEFD